MKNALIIILFDHPWEHTSDYASQTGDYLRKNNLVIGVLLKDAKSIKENIVGGHGLWLWKKQDENYYLVKPLYVIPFKRFRPIERVNIILAVAGIKLFASLLSWQKKFKKIYLWVFNPEHFSIVKLFGSSMFVIYDCVDFHGDEPHGSEEKLLMKTSNVVVVNSHALYNVHHSIRSDIHVVPLGFDPTRFSRKQVRRTIKLPHNQPIVGYIGGINSRLDYHLLLPLIRGYSTCNFVFVGPIQMHESPYVFQTSVQPNIDALLRFPNVYYYPNVSKYDTPQIIRQFDIGMIPYDCSRNYNKYSFPMKLFEYFYTGKPVVATPIEELKRFPKYVKIANTAELWRKYIASFPSQPWPKSYQKEQRRLAIQNGWEKKIDMIIIHINELDQSKKK